MNNDVIQPRVGMRYKVAPPMADEPKRTRSTKTFTITKLTAYGFMVREEDGRVGHCNDVDEWRSNIGKTVTILPDAPPEAAMRPAGVDGVYAKPDSYVPPMPHDGLMFSKDYVDRLRAAHAHEESQLMLRVHDEQQRANRAADEVGRLTRDVRALCRTLEAERYARRNAECDRDRLQRKLDSMKGRR